MAFSLAQRAGVAIATPYKLIGSKNQVIVALHAWETGRFSEQIDKLDEPDPVLRLLKSVDVALDIHLSDEPYFKALSRAAFTAMQPVQEYYDAERDRFFLNALQAMKAAGLIRAGYDIGLLATVLAHQYFACVRGWASGGIPSGELHARMGHALSLTLAAIVAPSRRAVLHDLALEHQETLLGSRQPGPKAEPSQAAPKMQKAVPSAP
jgi:AcrR family transcriptional regulator